MKINNLDSIFLITAIQYQLNNEPYIDHQYKLSLNRMLKNLDKNILLESDFINARQTLNFMATRDESKAAGCVTLADVLENKAREI